MRCENNPNIEHRILTECDHVPPVVLVAFDSVNRQQTTSSVHITTQSEHRTRHASGGG